MPGDSGGAPRCSDRFFHQDLLTPSRDRIPMHHKTDFLVVGSGVAGLAFALKVAPYGSVTIVTKKAAMDSNTSRAQGGIASVFGQLDSFDLHIKICPICNYNYCWISKVRDSSQFYCSP